MTDIADTTDGGKRGLKTQVSRSLAAQLIADGKVDLATAEEAAQFLLRVSRDWKGVEEEAVPAVQSKPTRPPQRQRRDLKG